MGGWEGAKERVYSKVAKSTHIGILPEWDKLDYVSFSNHQSNLQPVRS